MRIEITPTHPGAAPTTTARLTPSAQSPATAHATATTRARAAQRPVSGARRPFGAHAFGASPATPVPVRWDAVRG